MAEGPARAESPPPPVSEPCGARALLVPLLTERSVGSKGGAVAARSGCCVARRPPLFCPSPAPRGLRLWLPAATRRAGRLQPGPGRSLGARIAHGGAAVLGSTWWSALRVGGLSRAARRNLPPRRRSHRKTCMLPRVPPSSSDWKRCCDLRVLSVS